MKILFKENGSPYAPKYVRRCIGNFGRGYNKTVAAVIENSNSALDKDIFFRNVAMLMPNFLMGRAGPFKGVKYVDGRVVEPNGIIADCWGSIGEQSLRFRDFIERRSKGNRLRALLAMTESHQATVAAELWKMFKALLPVCMGKQSMGLVAASKVLFAVFPEVALPVDNAEWRHVFKTVDFGAVILQMANEIGSWENETNARLEQCDADGALTLPAVYNVMAMKARPRQ